jgi:hypothetical protein
MSDDYKKKQQDLVNKKITKGYFRRIIKEKANSGKASHKNSFKRTRKISSIMV